MATAPGTPSGTAQPQEPSTSKKRGNESDPLDIRTFPGILLEASEQEDLTNERQKLKAYLCVMAPLRLRATHSTAR